MSRELIHKCFNDIDRLRKFSGTTTEGVISEAFKDLLKEWARRKDMQFIAQYPLAGRVDEDGRPRGLASAPPAAGSRHAGR